MTPNCSSGRTTVIVASAPWRAVLGEQRAEVDVGEPVRVGGAERPLAREQRLEQLDPPARRRVEPGVHALDLPRPPGHGSAAANALDQLALVAGGEQEAA